MFDFQVAPIKLVGSEPTKLGEYNTTKIRDNLLVFANFKSRQKVCQENVCTPYIAIPPKFNN